MKLAIHQPQYMPWVGYFHKIASSDLFVLLDDVQFKKNEWQHRNRIRNPNGTQWLSVPNAYKFPEKINEVRVRDTGNWQEKHLKSLEMCYGKAAFFGNYHEKFKEFYSRKWETIDRVNIDSIQLLCDLLGIRTKIEFSSKHSFPGASTERLVSICRHFNADIYLAGAGGHDYMDLSLFEKAGIQVQFQSFVCSPYMQHWAKKEDDFIPNLSILDLLFNCGEKSLEILFRGDKITKGEG